MNNADQKRSKILWGVCGIGHGHTFRQLPLVDHFAQANRIHIFAYGESLSKFTQHFKDAPNVTISEVAVPFYVGGKDGIDFAATAAHPANQRNFAIVNAAALHEAQQKIGIPDLVVTDYEPVSAQYAYATNAPLVTLDQQTKYMASDFPTELNGQSYNDEIARLRMFFPTAAQRIACSFFDVASSPDKAEPVTIVPPVLGAKITAINHAADTEQKTFLVYLSSQQPFGQNVTQIKKVLASFPEAQFHIFGKNVPAIETANIHSYKHGDPKFFDILRHCHGIISTAGHSLLSEAMHLGIPVYAVPLPLYEQHMNAHVIDANGFGVSHKTLNSHALADFIKNLPRYSAAIQNDRDILLRQDGKEQIIRALSSHLEIQLRLARPLPDRLF